MNATAATVSSRRVTLAPNDAAAAAAKRRLCNNSTNNKSNTKRQKTNRKPLQFCWYWHENQYWWPALYFDSIMEAQMHCAPSMKNVVLKRHVASLALQEALQQLQDSNNNNYNKSRHCPTVALVDQNDDYWIVPLNDDDDDDDNDDAAVSRVVDRDEHDNNNTSFWDNLIVRFQETSECLQGNPALQARLLGAMQHLDKLNLMSLSSSSCPTLSSNRSSNQRQQQRTGKAAMAEEESQDKNHQHQYSSSDNVSVAATSVTASSSFAPRPPVAAAATGVAAASLNHTNDGTNQQKQQQPQQQQPLPNPLVPTLNTKFSSYHNSNSKHHDESESAFPAVAATADDENDDMMVDHSNDDDQDDSDENQDSSENDTMSNETRQNGTKSASSSSSSSSSSNNNTSSRDKQAAAAAACKNNEPEEWIPPMGEEGDEESAIQPDDAWETVEAKLEFSGWTKRRPATTTTTTTAAAAVALVNAFWWVKPGRPSGGSGGILNQDFFDNLSSLQAFCRRAYGWHGGTAAAAAAPSPPPRPEPRRRQSSRRLGDGMITPENRKTRPQHPGQPLLLDDDDYDDEETESSPIPDIDMNDATTGTVRSNSTTSSLGSARSLMSAADAENFARFWSKLKNKSGWKCYRGGPLEDWIYCKPGINPRCGEAQENVDYFKTPQAVLDYFKNKHGKKLFDVTAASSQEEEEEEDEAQSEEEAQNRKPKKSTKKPKPKAQPTKKRKLVTTASQPVGKKQKSSSSKKTTTGNKAAAAKKTTTTTTTADPHWWKTIPVPSSNDVWPILEQLKFSRDANGYYHLPGKDNLYNAMAFCSLQGLRTFLCLYGIPGRWEKDDDAAAADALDSDDAETLERWIKFANVPVTKRNSVAVLQNVSSPKSDAKLMQLLCDLGCSTLDGKLHLPISNFFRFQRRMNVHFFNLQNPESRKQARIAVRGQLWTFAKKNTVKVEHLLQVALWSATSSSHDLPVFVGLPETRNATQDAVHKYNKELLEKLAGLRALVSNPDDEELVEQLEEEEVEEDEETSATLEESSTELQSEDDEEHENFAEEDQDDEMSTKEEQDDELSVDPVDEDDDSVDSSVVKMVKRPPKATANKGKTSSKQAKTPKQPAAIVSQTTTKGKKQKRPATKKKQNKSKEPWWKTEPMPSGRSMWPILESLGFSIDDQRRYHLPADLYDAKSFGSIQTLRLFLCQYGIPNINSSRLSQKEKTLLINWVKFASVPVDAKNSVDKLANVSPPTRTDTIVQLLCKHGWNSFDDRLYVPGHSHDAKSREKDFDFFDLDQLETHVRLLVRGKLWTYRYDEKRQEQLHLQLALWAATAAGDLPTFTVMPDGDELKQFDNPGDIEESDVSECESDDMSMPTELLKAKPTSESDDVLMSTELRKAQPKKSKAKSAVEAVGASAEASVPKAKKEKKAKKDPRPFFMREPIPLLDQVWSTLEILGFKRNGNAFSHPQLPSRTFSNEASLRAFLVKERIEGLAIRRADLSLDDQEKLDHWVKWTHVPGLTPQSSVHKMQAYEEPSKNAIHQLLGKIGVKCCKIRVQSSDDEYHFPASDKDRQARREGIHYVVGLAAVRVHIRERSKAELEKEDDLDLSAIGSKELFLLRSWAASSEAPLPIFSKPKPDPRQARQKRASYHMESRKLGIATTATISAPDDGNAVGSAEVPLESNQESVQHGMIMDTAEHQSSQQQRTSPATAAPSPSSAKQDAEVNHVFQLEDPLAIQHESLEQNGAAFATSALDSNSHHQSLPTEACVEDDNDKEEWNETNLFTQ